MTVVYYRGHSLFTRMASTDKVSFSKMRSFFFLALIIGLSIAMMYLVRPFFYPIFWAAVIAIMFYPHYLWINDRLRSAGLSAGIMITVVVLTIFIPLALIATLLVNQSISLYDSLANYNLMDNVHGLSVYLANTPAGPYLENLRTDWPKYVSDVSGWLNQYVFAGLKSITQNSLNFFFMLFIMLYSLYYFFRDGERMVLRLMHLSPLGDKYEKMLFERFTSTARATIKGTMVIGVVQGTLGGILFAVTGVPEAFLWGLIMAVLSVIPALGTALIWLPAGIITLLLGNVWQGLTILLFGMFVISLIDNLLRPVLVGKDTEMHPLLVLFSTLGGIALFGITGFVIGPVIASLYLAIMSIYDHYYKNELEIN